MRDYWDRIYHRLQDGEANWHQDYPELSLQFIESAGVGSSSPILDVGGGTSLLVDNLLLKGYSRLSVLDISPTAIEQSRRRLGLNAGEIEWYAADVLSFIPPHPFALWHDRAVFHFLTDAGERDAYLRAMRGALEPGGQVILSTFAPHGPPSCSGLPVQRYDAAELEEVLGDDFSLVESWPEEHRTPAGESQPFVYTLFALQG